MKAKKKEIRGHRTVFDIEVPASTVSKVIEEVFGEIAKIAEIPGFRVGRAPLDLVRKKHAEKAKSEALKRLLTDSCIETLKINNISPIGEPEVSDVKFVDNQPLSFKITLDRWPEFTLKGYREIRLERPAAKVQDEDIEAMVENLREYNATYSPLDNAALEYGHCAICDMATMVNGKTRKRDDSWFTMDKKAVVPEIAENMRGMKKGDSREFSVTMPKDFLVENLSGKTVSYKVSVKEIKEKILPEVNDEFAKIVGSDTVDEMKKRIREELTRRAEIQRNASMRNSLMERLIKENKFEVPVSMVENQSALYVRDAKEKLVKKGIAAEAIEKKDQDLRKQFAVQAEKSVRLMFILDAVAKEQKITVDASEVDEAITLIAAQSGQAESKVRARYKKDGMSSALMHKIREDKVVAYLMGVALIEDKKEGSK
ncbi:MAG: trigger factor [Candidatus Omnitrophota bacterium]